MSTHPPAACDRAREALWPDPAGAAQPEARAHFEACPECQQFFRVQAALSDRLDRLDRVGAPATLRARLRGSAVGRKPRRRPLRAGLSVLALAAVAVLAVILGRRGTGDMDLAMPFATEARREMAAGEMFRSSDPTAVATWLADEIGRPVLIPDITGASVAGGRVVDMDGMRTAAVLYEMHGMPLTYFDVPAHHMAGRDLSNETGIRMAGVEGYVVAVWSERQGVRAVAAPMPEEDMRAVAEECKNKATMRAL